MNKGTQNWCAVDVQMIKHGAIHSFPQHPEHKVECRYGVGLKILYPKDQLEDFKLHPIPKAFGCNWFSYE